MKSEEVRKRDEWTGKKDREEEGGKQFGDFSFCTDAEFSRFGNVAHVPKPHVSLHFDILFSIFISQIFHGVWTIAFFCLNLVDTSRAVLPNASCLLAGYLPATTVLHILLIPNDYPLEFIIVDAVGTFLAIITMFLLLRMECTGERKRNKNILCSKTCGLDKTMDI